jgi:hypothetical protein
MGKIKITQKAYIRFKRDVNEYASSLLLFNEKFKNPYLINQYKSKIIEDEVYSANIYNDDGIIDPYKVDPARLVASKAKLWSRDFDSLNAEQYFKEYVIQINSTNQVFFAYFVFSGVVIDLISRREVYKMFKKKDDAQDEPQSAEKKNNFDLDEYYYDSDKKVNIDLGCTRSRRLLSRRENKKHEEWNDICYICGDHGHLICCDSCKNVCHLACAGLKVNFINIERTRIIFLRRLQL